MSNQICQTEDLPGFSRHLLESARLLWRFQWYLRNQGLFAALKRIPIWLAHRILPSMNPTSKAVSSKGGFYCDEILSLKPGELVEVKSEGEIRSTLDSNGRHRGLFFVPDMKEFCNHRLRVFKRVERVCLDDKPGEIRRVKHTVLLEGALCKGAGAGCDRSCFYFWREAWLRRVNKD